MIPLPAPDLNEPLNKILENIDWGYHNQLCLNSVPSKEDDPYYGAGSLFFEWHAQGDDFVKTPRTDGLTESMFTELCDLWKGTLFEDVYCEITKRYTVGRVRLMKLNAKTCLSWHQDTEQRLHYPIATNPGAFLIVENEVIRIPERRWQIVDTRKHHTAVNAGTTARIHLVAGILDDEPRP